MAQFKCYICNTTVKTGEKFTFTKGGSVHYDCFIAAKRKELGSKNEEKLRVLSLILDSQLQHLLDMLAITDVPEDMKEIFRVKYKDVEKACGETTRQISEL